jgi:DNA polymerase-3 subunit alpha
VNVARDHLINHYVITVCVAGFVHLHAYSEYSLLTSPSRITDLVDAAVRDEAPALALTDRGNLFGAFEFNQHCRAAGIRPVHGLEVEVVKDRQAEDPGHRGEACELVVLAIDMQGWQNLMKLSSRGYLEGLHGGSPHVDAELLAAHREGLICLTGGPRSHLVRRIREGDLGAARAGLDELRSIFGADLFVEIQNHGLGWEERVRETAAQIAQQTGVRLVATNQAHYARAEQSGAMEVQWAIRLGRTVDDPTWERLESANYHLRPAAEMRALFVEYPDAVSNTLEIAERCDVVLERDRYLLPEFPLPDGFDQPDDYLRHLTEVGARARYGEPDERVRERLDYELKVIEDMDFAGYFLITSDFVRAARERDIPVGPGRGSAAGSIVCYSLGITDIDPLEHDLLFERFLNPARVSMPDIDIDFCFEGRERVIQYVIDTYGKSAVCQIITFGKMLARGVVRDVGRAMGMGYGETDRIARMVPDELKMTLTKALEQSEELRGLGDEDPRYGQLLQTCFELEGIRRHSSIHAAGVLIVPGELIDHVPLARTGKNEITTQWDMNEVEKMGLLKMDFLGLRTLTVIDKALRHLPDLGAGPLRPGEIPLDDPEVYQMLGRGDTIGVFQLESSGMREILRRLRPSGFGDITAVNALFRPGPLGSGMVDDFIERKHGRKQVEYLHPMLEPILEPTYGTILYQEQVMRIASDMGGFSLGEADKLRRAMGKKKEEEMASAKIAFIRGAVGRGVDERIAGEIFELMAYFAGYGFNKSHSAAYAVLAVQTAWLKVHWPTAFLAAAMTTEMNTTKRVVALVDEARRMGIEVLPPDVNRCGVDFVPEAGGVRFGLGGVKNVGRGAIEAVVEARDRLGGKFRDFYEFCEEIDLSRVNRRVIEALVLAGALDALDGRREQKLAALDLALARAQRRARDRERGQGSLFGAAADASGIEENSVLPEVPAWETRERLRRERDLLGVYLSGHPLDEERLLLRALRPQRSVDATTLEPDRSAVLCGVVTDRQVKPTRKQTLMAVLSVADLSGMVEMRCFGEDYEKNRVALSSDDPLVLLVRTRKREADDATSLILEKAIPLTEAAQQLVSEVRICVPANVAAEVVDELLHCIAEHPGRCPLVVEVVDGDDRFPVTARRAAILPSGEFVYRLARILGEDAVHLEAVPIRRLGPRSGRPRPRFAHARAS